jgi:ABC-2 type transport system permease protein
MKQILAIMYREALIRLTSPLWLFFDMAVPLLYLLLFGVGFNKAVGFGIQTMGVSVSYNDFFLAGVLSMSCFGSAINQAYGFFVDRDNGIFYEFLTYPMTRGQFLFGRIFFQCLMSVAQAVLTITAAYYLLHVQIQWQFLPLIILGVMIGIAGWFFFLATFAFKIRRNDTFNTFINVVYFVLMFVSSMFYPLDAVPYWLKIFAYANPLTWHTDILRYLTIGIGNKELIMPEILGFGIFLGVTFWSAVTALKKTA